MNMAFVDNEELNSEEFAPVDELAPAPKVQETQPANELDDSPAIPPKYRGKKLEDIINMHQEAEKLIGRQAQEVGEVRRLADELLKQQLSKKAPEPQTPQEVDDLDFFEDPKKAISKAVDSHPDIVAARNAAQQLKKQQAAAQIQAKHPDMGQIVQDPEFVDWVKGSPVRMQLYTAADQQFDPYAADELLSTFKAIRTRKQTELKEVATANRNQSLKAANVESTGTGETSRKIYRRADLIRLRLENPDRYDSLSDEIMKAYSEGRVR